MMGFPGGSEVNLGSIPGLGRSLGEGNGNPLQYSCLENPMDRGAWWATVHAVAKSRTRLSVFTFTLNDSSMTSKFQYYCQNEYKCIRKLRYSVILNYARLKSFLIFFKVKFFTFYFILEITLRLLLLFIRLHKSPKIDYKITIPAWGVII